MKKTVTLEKKIGLLRTTFKADIEVDDYEVRLLKGYVQGFTGVTFTIAGQTMGFGVAKWEFWLTQQERKSTREDVLREIVATVHVSYDRPLLLVLKNRKEFVIGEYVVDIPSPRITWI